MKRIIVLAQLALATVLASCGAGAPATESPPPVPTYQPAVSTLAFPDAGGPLTMASSSEAIRQRMLLSHLNWHRLWVEARTITHLPHASVTRQQIWLDPAASSFRFLSGPASAQAEHLAVADGKEVRVLTITTGQSEAYALAPMNLAGYAPDSTSPDSISPHPMAGQIGTPVAGLVFSTELAQRGGTYVPVASEPIAGRDTVVVDWVRSEGMRPSRYWVDAQTGVVLRSEEYGKSGGTQLEREIVVDQVIYDPTFVAGSFDLTAWPPAFTDVFGNPLGSGSLPEVTAADDPLGVVYLTRPSGAGQTQLELLRLPASCVLGLAACGAPEVVPTPFALPYVDANGASAWSLSTGQAVFAFPATAGGLAALRLFDAAANEWSTLAEFRMIDVPSFSGDGQWITFRIQDEAGAEQQYVVRFDGSGMRNLTPSSLLPEAERPFVVDGWIGDNVILRSGRPGHEGAVYLVRASDGAVRPLFASQLTKAAFVPSPDGSLVAWAEFNSASQANTLKVMAPDGATYRELATFQGTLYPVAWSPAITHLALNVYGAPNAQGDEVYVIRRDGRDLRQVLRSEGVQRLMFSPDGAYLLVAAAGPAALVAVDLATLRVNVLRLGQGQPDFTWRLVGWQARR